MTLENTIRDYRKYIGYSILFFACISPLFLSIPGSLKFTGEKAIMILWIILWIPILARVFGIRIFAQILPLRKELGILMGVLAMVHGFSYLIPNQAILNHLDIWWKDGRPTFLFFGSLAMFLSIPLTLTSSVWAMKKLGRHWKTLHRLVYFIAIFAIAHVMILQSMRHFDPIPLIFLGLYCICKILEWRGFSFRKKTI